MPDLTIPEFAILAAAALPASLALVWLLGLMPGRPGRRGDSGTSVPTAACHFLFRDGTLLDHDAGDLPAQGAAGTDWDRLRDWLGFRFADLPPSPEAMARGEVRRFHSHLPGDPARLDAQLSGRGLRLRLCEDPPPSAAALNEIRRARHMAAATLQAMHAAPYPAWISDAAGLPIWQNTAATALPEADKARMTAEVPPPPESGDALTRRVGLPGSGAGAPQTWFDVTVACRPEGRAIFATDVSALVAAETAQREFVQTLGRTFADLPTGLAVFDRAKTLVLFNPALTDLTGLQVEFLSARPEIVTFFDMLRDRQVMPEPKNYASWRSQINDMVSAAHGGHYREMWSLANGRSYRVTGRPHPNGAVAFLFEDISAEITQTRHQRGELALRDTVLDGLDAAIAVLSQDGRVVFCNRAFTDLLGMAPDTPLDDLSLPEVMQACRARFPDPTLWSEISDRITSNAVGHAITERVAPDGAGLRLDLRLAPLGQGRAMLLLHRHAPEAAPRTPLHTG